MSEEQGSSLSKDASREDEIRILEERLQRLREVRHEPSVEEKEPEKAPESSYAREIPSGAPSPAAPAAALPVIDEHFHSVKTKELKTYQADKQLKALVEIAFERGLKDAVEIAKRLENAYLLDAFHDTLVDELHKELVAQGKLEEI